MRTRKVLRVILPYEFALSRLLVKFTHLISLHVGNQIVMSHPFQYWAPKVKNLVRAVLSSCVHMDGPRPFGKE